MGTTHTLGLIGFGRIGRSIYEFARSEPTMTVEYVFVRSTKADLPVDLQVTDPTALRDRTVDLCIEAATYEVLADLGALVLETSNFMILSGSAFADPDVYSRIETAAESNGTAAYLPHAALLGLDGLVDARSELNAVELEAVKAPDHLDFSYNDELSPTDISGRTTVYEGSVRGLCRLFPRNFNSHAAVALAGLGLDETRTTLIADPSAKTADHVISATGDGFELEITRRSAIEGVTGDYTIVSLWGSMQRVLGDDRGIEFA